jgi:hypothetical protein
MTMKRMALVLTLAAITAALLALNTGIAGADPVNSKKAEILTISCDGQPYDVVLSWGGGSAHILDGTGNIVAKTFTFTAIDPETGEELFSETFSPGKKVGLEGDLRTCTAGPFPEFDPELGEEITFLITVEALFTPRD